MLVLGCPDCGKEHPLLSDDQAITCYCGFVLTDEKTIKVGVKVTVPKITQGEVRVYDGGTVMQKNKKPFKIESTGKNHYFNAAETPIPFWGDLPLEYRIVDINRMHTTVKVLKRRGFLS